jgi:hypothetical protein
MPTVEKKAQTLYAAAKDALTEGVERVERFKSVEEFHRSLVKALESHGAFGDAARALHSHVNSVDHSGKGQTPRTVVPAGRVQAPRHDTPKGRSMK